MDKIDCEQSECTYDPELGTCFNENCPKCCFRNYRDEMNVDIPIPAEKKPVSKSTWAKFWDKWKD